MGKDLINNRFRNSHSLVFSPLVYCTSKGGRIKLFVFKKLFIFPSLAKNRHLTSVIINTNKTTMKNGFATLTGFSEIT